MISTTDDRPPSRDNPQPVGSDLGSARGLAAGCGLGAAIWASLLLLCVR